MKNRNLSVLFSLGILGIYTCLKIYLKYSNNKLARYSIRKYSIGVASVLIGFFFMGVSVSADQMTEASAVAPSSLVTENSDATVASTNTEIGKSTEVVQVNTPEVPLGSPNETRDEVKPDTIKKSELSISELDTSNKVSENSTTPVLETKDEKETPKVVAEDKQADTIEQVDPTNPEGKKTVGYAAANTDKPKTSIVNDVTRIRATKKDGKYIHSANVNNVSSGDVVLFSAGGGSIARGDDYPQRFKNGRIWVDADDWGQYVRECTSFVAYRLSTVNGFTIPYAYGDAGRWGYRARSEGYRVDNTPALGSVAWYDNQYQHVAWVSNVMGDYIELEEYNWNDDHIYHRQVVNKNTVTGFIHFKDINRVVDDSSNHPSPSVDQEVPESGVYYFKGRASIKSEPKMSSPELAYYDAGQSVNYDRKLIADGHEWISYTSYSGTRRYVDLGAVAEAVAKPRGDISIESHNNGDFSVVISNVSDQNGVLGVSVPIWSETNGQDDIIWYNATRLNNGNYKVNVSLTDHKNERGLYNVHLYYVETNGKLVGVGGTTYTVPVKVEETHTTTSYSLPDAGTYTFKERTGIKAEPRVASPELAYYDAGMSVNYDKIVSGDGYEWLSYLSYNGNRRYVAVAKLAQQESKPSGTINIENLSNLGFDVHITNVSGGDKAIQGVSVPVWTAQNGQDDLVWHQADRQSDGSYKVRINVSDHKAEAGEYIVHLYYIQDGKMVGIGGTSTTVPVQNATRHNLPASGSYTFTARTGIKAEPRVASPELAYYDVGMSVNYDKIVSGDGYEWLSYLSYNGNRRYVAVAKLAQQESKPSGTINIENLSNLGFDVHITNVSGGDKAIQGVSVPVWTAKDGQDDLVWHQADRQSDGSYKVRINVSDHKAEAGEYIVHLYYIQDGKMVGIGGTSTTVPVQNATRHNLPASGSYTFTARTGIKTQPLVANPDVSYYDAGMSVNYDKVVNNDGYTWLSYLSYSGHRFYVAIAPTSVTKPVEQPVQPSTPSSGTYTFKERSSIKAEPSVASPELAYYDAGMSVNYDRLVTADGHTWLSYVSHGGNRRYIAIDAKATAVAQPASPSLAATGTYTFTKPSSIKAQPSVASPELAYYDKGMSVRYDKVLTADGHTWLSYVTYSGARRYVDIA